MIRLLLSVLLLVFSPLASATPGLVVIRADRKVELQSNVVRVIIGLNVENGNEADASDMLIALSKQQAGSLAYVRAVAVEGKKSKKAYDLSFSSVVLEEQDKGDERFSNVSFFSIAFRKPLKQKQRANVELFFVLLGLVQPHPAEILQSEPQLVQYFDSHYVLLPYPVYFQTSSLRLPSQQLESYTKLAPSRVQDGEVKLGPYENIEPLTWSPLVVHYENQRPFAEIELAVREFQISHWGNVYVTEDYHIVHNGAKHKGPFSRFEYQSRPMVSGVSSLRGLIAELPPRVHSVFFRDEIGNISSTHLAPGPTKTRLEIEPRFPLMGGWSTTFQLGYSVPLSDFLSISPDGRRILNVTFGTPFADLPVRRLVVKVVLPEGATEISSNVPFEVSISNEVKFSYLDTVGRPVLVLEKTNVVLEHSVNYFQVAYKFSPVFLLVEPLLLVAAFFLFFLTFIAYVRLDFTIAKNSPVYLARLQQEEVADLIQRLLTVFAGRAKVTEKIEQSMAALARTGDVAAAKTERKSAEASLKESAKDVKGIVERLEAMPRPPSSLKLVLALVAKEKEKQEKVLQQHTAKVELYERKAAFKEIDAKMQPFHMKLQQLKAEVKELKLLLEDC
eukprot:TRINITY_DN1433_c0_g1_i1.p1 TRINITY_DN1433_c0_g1~~TRINITY_DN1433_c0_g1_i1.p1  ORF type:complete len:617 (+),score=210.95 TRINITY_DN1433_c0_g1_i1:73-1923(+)